MLLSYLLILLVQERMNLLQSIKAGVARVSASMADAPEDWIRNIYWMNILAWSHSTDEETTDFMSNSKSYWV